MKVIVSTNFKAYNSVDFSTLVISGNHQLYVVPEHFHLLPKGTPVPSTSHSCSPCPQPPAASTLLAFSVDLPVLDISYKLNHTTCVLCVWLLSLSLSSGFIPVVACISFIPYYARIAFHWMHRPHCVYPFTS